MKPIYQIPPQKEGNPVVGFLILILIVGPVMLSAIVFWTVWELLERLGGRVPCRPTEPRGLFGELGQGHLSPGTDYGEAVGTIEADEFHRVEPFAPFKLNQNGHDLRPAIKEQREEAKEAVRELDCALVRSSG